MKVSMHRLGWLLLALLALELLLVDTCEAASRRRTGKDKGDKDKEKKEKKDKKDEKEDEELEDASHLEPNATLKCFRCSGGACADSFYEHQVAVEKVLCDPGEICWKSRTKRGYLRGCASRACSPSAAEAALLNATHGGANGTTTHFLSNMCCTKDFCNEAGRLRGPEKLPLLLGLVLVSAVALSRLL